jgi:hypothetical protein
MKTPDLRNWSGCLSGPSVRSNLHLSLESIISQQCRSTGARNAHPAIMHLQVSTGELPGHRLRPLADHQKDSRAQR